MAELILRLCRDTNSQVLTILNEIAKKEDVTEFITTIQRVQITINGLLKSKAEFKFDLLKDLQNTLKDYETLLVQLNDGRNLIRMLTSNRLRRKIEHANSQLHTKLEEFKKSIKADDTMQPMAVDDGAANGSGIKESGQMTATAALEEEVENLVRLSIMIEDPDGKEIWAELFGLETFMIEWDDFVSGLRKILTDIKEDEEKVLQYILDNSNTGFINQHKFSEFLKGFGQVQDSLKNVKRIISSPWFYGFLSRQEAELLLRDQPPGTFLIRLSATQPGSFALGFVKGEPNGEKTACHILVNSLGPQEGFSVQENQNARKFASLHEIVDYYSVFLVQPLNSSLPFESWFEGDMSSGETNDVLSGMAPGTFLVRFSSQKGAYAVSFVNSEGLLSHSLIEHENVPGGGYRIVNDGQPLVFNSLREVVSYYGDALQYPYKETSNHLHVEAMHYFNQWKQECQQEMATVEALVNDLFEVNTVIPEIQGKTYAPDARVDAIISRLFDNSYMQFNNSLHKRREIVL